MLSLTVNVGQAVQIGEHGAIKVEDKSGRRVRLTFAMPSVFPIAVITSGIIPARFTVGISGERRPVPPPNQGPLVATG